jgi:methane monooxygenase PmoA-like
VDFGTDILNADSSLLSSDGNRDTTREAVKWNRICRRTNASILAFAALVSVLPALPPSVQAKDVADFTIERKADAVVVAASNGREILRYQLQRPTDSNLSVEHAPKQNRRIVNRSVTGLKATAKGARFRALNEWLAAGERVIGEDLRVSVRTESGANIIELVYELTPDADVTLSQWAFSGFCVRTRKDGELEAYGPGGLVSLPNPKHTEPASDWPAAKWCDYALRLGEGKSAGVAVIDHPRNPPSLWHNHRDVRMLNPCIVAPGPMTLKAKKPLVLRYRVVAHDGPVDKSLLDRLAGEWSDR